MFSMRVAKRLTLVLRESFSWAVLFSPAEVTANAFKLDPFDTMPGELMYKTGDEAKVLLVVLEVCMFKVRGYLVVPETFESVILSN